MALTYGRLAIGMVTTDCADPSGLAAFWAAALGTAVSGDYGEFVMLAPPPAGGPVLGFQRRGDATAASSETVPASVASRSRPSGRAEERAGRNHLHLDLGAATGERHAEVERLVGLGATVVGERGGDAEGLVWTTLTDPEGNEFCVAEH